MPKFNQQITISTSEDAQRKQRAFEALMVARRGRGCTETQFRVPANAVPRVEPNWPEIERMRQDTAVARGVGE